jgi:hypothetical protein
MLQALRPGLFYRLARGGASLPWLEHNPAGL